MSVRSLYQNFRNKAVILFRLLSKGGRRPSIKGYSPFMASVVQLSNSSQKSTLVIGSLSTTQRLAAEGAG